MTPSLSTSLSNECFDGFFCATGTTPWTVFESPAPKGYFCKEETAFRNRLKFRCPVGFYCPSGTGYNSDLARPMMPRAVHLTRPAFYKAQKLAQYCGRRTMVNQAMEVQNQITNYGKAGITLEETLIVQTIDRWYEIMISECTVRALVHVLGEDLLTIANCNPDTGAAVCRYQNVGGTFPIAQMLQCDETGNSNNLQTCMRHIRFHAKALLSAPTKPPHQFTNKCMKFHQSLGPCLANVKADTSAVQSQSIYRQRTCDRAYFPSCPVMGSML